MTTTTTTARGLTDSLVAHLVMLSGGMSERFAWRGVGGTSRPAAATRRGLRVFLADVQEGLCPDCGTALEGSDKGTPEFAHVVTRGMDAMHSDEGKGWTPGNIMLAHRLCNRMQQARGPVVLPEHLTRPDLVATEWLPVPVLKSLAA
jgi:hypothetical protein